jgi:hypothetical protein
VEEYWNIIRNELETVSGNFKYVLKTDRLKLEKIGAGQIKLVYADLPILEVRLGTLDKLLNF